jgi:hypothetical protein
LLKEKRGGAKSYDGKKAWYSLIMQYSLVCRVLN